MSKPGMPVAPPSGNVSDMLAILADPAQYRKHLEELKATHKDIETRLGLYNTLEKIQAYHKQVKEEAAAASKSAKDAEALWAKVEQASKDVTDRSKRLDGYKVSLDEAHAVRMSTLAKDLSAHLADRAQYEQDMAALAEAKDKLRHEQAKHDARMSKAKDKLAAVVAAVKGVEAL